VDKRNDRVEQLLMTQREKSLGKAKGDAAEKIMAQFNGYMSTILKKKVENDPKFGPMSRNPNQEYTWMTSYLKSLDEDHVTTTLTKLQEDFNDMTEE